MTTTQRLRPHLFPFALIALITLTRYHHFGDALHLPDASLAVFFLAGFYRRVALFGFLLLLAGAIDYVAIESGTSAWCVSPAYIFLIPTYGVMWLAGRYGNRHWALDSAGAIRHSALLLLSSSLAFIISNGSFYLFSDRFAEASLVDYFAGGMPYFLPYVGSAFLYSAVFLGIVKLLTWIPTVVKQHKSA